MKVGICCFPKVGGSGIAASQLALGLAQKGHKVNVISYDTPFLLKTTRHPNITLTLVDILSYPLFKDIGAPYTILCASKMINTIKEEGLDIINVHYSIPTAVSAYLAKSFCDIPIAITPHGSDIHILGIDPAYNPVISEVLKHADGVSTVSNYMKREIEEKFTNEIPIRVIYNAIDTERFKRTDFKICDFRMTQEKYLLHVSNFRPVKNGPFIVECFAEVLKEYPNTGLIMIGEGPERKKCAELARELDIQDNVLFQGVRIVLSPIYTCSSALLSASSNESFGLTLAEAMACETPVIAPNVGGIPEVVDHGKSGFIYEPNNKEQFIKYICQILEDSQLEKRLGRNGRQRVKKHFNLDKITDQYLDWFQETINRSK